MAVTSPTQVATGPFVTPAGPSPHAAAAEPTDEFGPAVAGRADALAEAEREAMSFAALARSEATYAAELPGLLETNWGQWVAYFDGVRAALAPSQDALYRRCLNDLALDPYRLMVRRVLPDIEYDINVLER